MSDIREIEIVAYTASHDVGFPGKRKKPPIFYKKKGGGFDASSLVVPL
jgi:hypothetical protein